MTGVVNGRICGGTRSFVCAIWRCRCRDCLMDMFFEARKPKRWQLWKLPAFVKDYDKFCEWVWSEKRP